MRARAETKLSASVEWATPAPLFDALNARFGPFELDAAASSWNTCCGMWFNREADGLKQDWTGRVWLNPPYSRGSLDLWMAKARGEVLKGHAEAVCCLVPHYTSEGWWHEQVESREGVGAMRALHSEVHELGASTVVANWFLDVEVLRLRGRVRFVEKSGATGSARYSSVAVVFAQPGKLWR